MNIVVFAVVIIYFLFLALAVLPRSVDKTISKQPSNSSFFDKYFLADRNMTSFSMAISFVATYIGASSFIGGPGIAYKFGLSWVLLAAIQIPTLFISLASVGPKLLNAGKKYNLVTINDFIYYRYKNRLLVIYLSLALIFFSFISISAQITAAGEVISLTIGINRNLAMVIFSLIVFVYTSVGGLKLIIKTDKIQGFIMIIASLVLFITAFKHIGFASGLENKISSLGNEYISPLSDGKMDINFLYSFWVLVGVGIIGLPVIISRVVAFKNNTELYKSLFTGTAISGFLMIVFHLTGFFAIFILPSNIYTDSVIPSLAVKILNPFMLGIFVAGFLAIVMSSVDSILLMLAGTIIKDLNLAEKLKYTGKKLKNFTRLTTFIIGLISLLIAIQNFDTVVWLNLLSLAGQESVFFIPIVAGLFIKKIDINNLIIATLLSNTIFLFLVITKISFFDFHPILPSLLIGSIVIMIKHKNQLKYIISNNFSLPFSMFLIYFSLWTIGIISYNLDYLKGLFFGLPYWFWLAVILNFIIFTVMVYFYSYRKIKKIN